MKTIETTIIGHKVVSREEWIAARISLLYLVVRRLGRFIVVKEALSREKSHRPTIQTKEIALCKQPT